ncbi:enoyl-CoA hydratase-related protein [Tepidiforma sp.]|uniref:enoyl-CoA hydratase-related protein n=1 Tax=Tepidiforma sp. TaxID=2682230 RepID=UPI002ADE5F7C|nr:enoyl-CoA hydratase-related protein [Tepidiforma sp.]
MAAVLVFDGAWGGREPGWVAAWLEALPEDARAAVVEADGLAGSAPASAEELRALVVGRVPVIAWFEGELRGAALDLALAADVRICGAGAALRGPTVWPARARLLGRGDAGEALAAGSRLIGSEEALAAGLVGSVTAPGSARAEALRLAEVMASRGPIALALAKEAIWRGLALPLEQALRFETDLTLLLQTTKDRAEGVRAFLEKRKPLFTGE